MAGDLLGTGLTDLLRSEISTAGNEGNANGKLVATTIFMDPDNAGISAVIAYSSDRSKTPLLTADVVHNHLAKQPVEQGLLGPDNLEWGKISETDHGLEIGKLTADTVRAEGSALTPHGTTQV